MIDHIPSDQLTLADIPDAGATEDDLWLFGHNFHAYDVWGGFDEAFQALERKPEGRIGRLDLIRTDLFLDLRASRHRGDNPYWESVREQIQKIRSILGAE